VGPAVTALKERAEQQIPAANQIFNDIQRLGVTDPNVLMQALTVGANALYTAYDNPQGPGGPLTIDAYYRHTGEDPAPLRAQQQQLMTNIWNTVQTLHQAGVTNAQLGALPVNPKWGDPSLGGLAVLDYRNATAPVMGSAQAGQSTPTAGAGAAAIASGGFYSPAATTVATGGPFMSLLAALNPTLFAQLNAQITLSAPAVQAETDAMQAYAALIDQMAYQDFTSGGG
jgi:hypothetical protein